MARANPTLLSRWLGSPFTTTFFLNRPRNSHAACVAAEARHAHRRPLAVSGWPVEHQATVELPHGHKVMVDGPGL